MKSLYGELKDISISKPINTIVEAMVQRGENEKVLVFTVRLEAEDYKTEHRVARRFHILYYRPSSYTFVGLVESSESFFSDKQKQDIKRFSYHDSCWRYDGTERIIGVIVDEMLKEIPEGKDSEYSVFTDFDVKEYPGKVIDYDLDKNSVYVPLKKTETLKNKAILKALEVLDAYDVDGQFYGSGLIELREILTEAKEDIYNGR